MLLNTVYNVRKIVLILGTACNFNCIYCVQHDNKPRCKKQIKPELLAWLDEVAYQLPLKLKPVIHFYGGEPLLYREAIREVVEHCGDDFNYLISSNGAYLTDEDVEFFNKHNVEFMLSNDGPNTSVSRQIDMLTYPEFVERFNRLNKRGVDGVISALNQDFYAFFEHVEKHSPGTPVSHEDLICNEHTDPRLTAFDIEKLLSSYKRMGEELEASWETGQESNGADTFNRFLKQALFSVNHPQFPDFGICGTGKSVLNVDTQGNVYLCKNFNVKIGTIADEYEVLYERAKEATKELRDQHLEGKGCFSCPAFFFCRGGCPFEKPSEQQKQKCEMLRAKWASVVSFIDNKMQMEVKDEDSAN